LLPNPACDREIPDDSDGSSTSASFTVTVKDRSDLSTNGPWIPVTNVPAAVGDDLVVGEAQSWFQLLKQS
jgi:hypothetical protein